MAKPIVITISGRSGHGKSTFAEYLEEELEGRMAWLNVRRDRFAKGVKEKALEVGWDGKKDQNGRALLQFIGTEWGRQCINQDIWVKDAAERISKDDQVIIFDDARFYNEVEYFALAKQYTSWAVKLVRINSDGNIWDNELGELKDHASELDLPDELFDKIIRHYHKGRLRLEAKNMAKDILNYLKTEVK